MSGHGHWTKQKKRKIISEKGLTHASEVKNSHSPVPKAE